jgi:hypothetical protein
MLIYMLNSKRPQWYNQRLGGNWFKKKTRSKKSCDTVPLRSKIFALLKSLKTRALENYCMSVCYVTLTLTPSGLNLCQIVKTVHKT